MTAHDARLDAPDRGGDPAPVPGDAELAGERTYVHALYERLDALTAEARARLVEVRAAGGAGGTHQSRTERDAFARLWEDRLAQLSGVGERLAFGRLDYPSTDDAPVRYIGRIGLRDEDQRPLLLDWRAPGSRAFYQATAASPLGVRARRQLQTRGRDVVHIDDEIFDRELLDGETALRGDAALLASVSQRRTGRMTDIVATIQAEQDRIIRSELHGTLVVQGGPGTGKTAVALHRAAYLLYTHRERLGSSGVLIVGPSRSFLQYIEAVLPALGETGVVLASVGELFPGVETNAQDAPDVAALKGSLAMSRLIARAVRSRQRVPDAVQTVDVDGERVDVPPELIRQAMQRAWDSHQPHNQARTTFNRAAVAAITRLLADQLRARGRTLDDTDVQYLREDVRGAYDVKVALNTAWLPLTPQRFLEDLYARPQWLASLTPRWRPATRELLRRERGASFTVSDVPLLDEAAELLGDFDGAGDAHRAAADAQRERDLENAEQAIRNMGVEGIVDARQLAAGFAEEEHLGTTAERAAADRSWIYGHVVVDEAQELTPMQWRMLLRRAPHRSFTVVGDIAQASSAGSSASWADAMGQFGDDWRIEELTVNYRTPAQIARVAESVALEHDVRITPSTSVREGEWPVMVTATSDAVAGAVDAVAADRAIDDEGTLVVVAPDELVDAVEAALEQRFGGLVGRDSRGLGRGIAVMTPLESKGLEFDAVVLVEPARIIAASPRGASALYVAMTRATQRLRVVAAEPLPAGLSAA